MPRPATTLVTFVGGLVLFGGLALYMQRVVLPEVRAARAALGEVRTGLERLEESVAYLNFTRDPAGNPIQAILDHLRYWEDRAQRFGSSLAEQPVLEEHKQRAVKALRGLGPEAFDAVERAFLTSAGDPERSSFRRSLLRILADLDPPRAADLCLAQLGTAGVSTDIRTLAADLAVDLAPERAAKAVRDVLLQESYRGRRHVLPGSTPAGTPPLAQYEFPGFFNLVGVYLRTRDPEKVDVLLVMLNQEGHDVPTLQEIVRGLEEKKDERAIGPLQRLFEDPRTPAEGNPLLRRRCAQAVAGIQGGKACTWLRDMLAKEKNDIVARSLQSLLRQYCG